eukprot:COSAG02_NODE_715_length_18086_cov_109.753433_15_plen_95_part_00
MKSTYGLSARHVPCGGDTYRLEKSSTNLQQRLCCRPQLTFSAQKLASAWARTLCGDAGMTGVYVMSLGKNAHPHSPPSQDSGSGCTTIDNKLVP